MAKTKAELMAEKMKQQRANAFETGSKPVVEMKPKEPAAQVPTTQENNVIIRETKNRRIQILTYGSLVDRMDAYANKRGMSRAEVFEAAVRMYLEQYDN